MKKYLSFMLALTMVFCMTVPYSVTAVTELDWSGENVSPFDPLDLLNQAVPFGTSSPTTTYDLHTNALYSFHGNAISSRLWLNQYMIGCLKYGVSVTNTSSQNKLKFTVRGISGGDQSFTLPPNTSTEEYFGDDAMFFDAASRNTLICISFEAPSAFQGWICCAD